ncbi:ABC transporter permease [Spiractinospora alimapuensis]|uniref:ABC transporter permease n=1 Tax=Spiractinospora alimapuensis TaxID=2820884 RepID=UPI001F1B2A9E|nr:ABC transporter permease [Spiractinospora alimapuensis]QVQ52484.1 ABC transporter permease [Spiractinospora alimapuensis]
MSATGRIDDHTSADTTDGPRADGVVRAEGLTVLRHLTVAETKMILRDPTPIIGGILFPTVILLALGAIPMLREPSPDFGGVRFVDAWAPTALIFGMVMLGLVHLPNVVAAYREQGVLRRMSTTPAHPGLVLTAQLLVVLTAILISAGLLLVSARLVLGIALPQQPWLFAVAFLVGNASLIALGMLVAAVAPNARAANGVAMALYFVLMLVGGLFLPRVFLPDVLVRLGEVLPPGIQLLLDTWTGIDSSSLPYVAQIGIMGGIAVGAAVAAARLFRWE